MTMILKRAGQNMTEIIIYIYIALVCFMCTSILILFLYALMLTECFYVLLSKYYIESLINKCTDTVYIYIIRKTITTKLMK